MNASKFLIGSSLALLGFLFVGSARGANEGQSDLDKATKAQITAESLDDLQKVLDFVESALKKGLDADNTKFAKELGGSVLYQRAEKFASAIFDRDPPSPQWPAIRTAAVRDLERAVEFQEKFGNAHLLLARLYSLPAGSDEKAAKHANIAVELLKENKRDYAKALVVRGTVTGTPEARLSDFSEALKIDPANLDALRSRGLLFQLKDKNEEALADILKAIETKEDDLGAQMAACEILTELKKYDEAMKHAERVVKLLPRKANGFLLKARVHIMQEDLKGAIQDATDAIKVEPESLQAILLRARLRHTSGEKEEARKDLEKALTIQPGLPQAILTRSMFSASEGKYDAAIRDMEQLLEADPGNTEYLLQVAAYLVSDKRPRKAIKTIESILSVDKTNLQALRSRGDALLSIGKQKEAMADFEAIIKAEPDNSGALNNLAWTLATSTDEKLREGKRALELATKACELTKYKAAHIISTLASAYAETGDFENARKWSQKAVDEAEEDVKDQLKKELESYKENKPWRELQQTEEKKEKKPGGELDL